MRICGDECTGQQITTRYLVPELGAVNHALPLPPPLPFMCSFHVYPCHFVVAGIRSPLDLASSTSAAAHIFVLRGVSLFECLLA